MLEQLYTSPRPGALQVAHQRAVAVAGQGLEGDRYFGRCAHRGDNLTLVAAEEIEAFLQELGRPYEASVTRRNLVTRGVTLNGLVGVEFSVGAVRLRGVELCEPCLSLGWALARAQVSAAAVVARLVGRGGLRADVLSSGVIARGDRIVVVGPVQSSGGPAGAPIVQRGKP